jgi:hypothetical protein
VVRSCGRAFQPCSSCAVATIKLNNAVQGGSELPILRPAGARNTAYLSHDSKRVPLDVVDVCSSHSGAVLAILGDS